MLVEGEGQVFGFCFAGWFQHVIFSIQKKVK